ncbi:MAG: YkgJ family cysteine cluster protein [Acidobacteriota bacterium]|nr:YkgJ family cysteine cluster protein [Acidobacteriota bacterium]
MEANQFVQITRRERFSEEEFYPIINAMYEQIWGNLLPPQLVTEKLPTNIADNIVTPAAAPVPDCVTCGACCGSMPCVAVSQTDKIAAENYWDITTNGANGEITVDRYLRRSGTTLACANLDGEIGNRVGCQIYEQRPQTCRVFEAGSDKCHALRRAYGIEPFLTVEEMSSALRKLEARDGKITATETIREAKISEKAGTNLLEITALMEDGTMPLIHTFDPQQETHRQYQFSGLTLIQARSLIELRSGAKRKS